MNVAQVLSYLGARYGGPPQVAFHLGCALTDLGHTVSYWGTGEEGDLESVGPAGGTVHRHAPRWPRRWFRSPALARELAGAIDGIDLLHLHELWTDPLRAAAALARRRGKPYVLCPHGIFTEPWRFNTLKKRLYLALLGNRIIRGAACLHAVNAAEIEGIRRLGLNVPAAILPNGIDPRPFACLPDSGEADEYWPALKDRRLVLFLSRLSPEKGLDQLIPAWAELGRRGGRSDALLVLAGPDHNGYRATVEALVSRHGIQSDVLLPGFVQDRRKMALIARADLYVLPSHSEGFSVSLLENMAAAKPVVFTPACHFPEAETAGAGVCVCAQSGALAEAIGHLLERPASEREAMGRRGRELVLRDYTWDAIARKVLTVYRCIREGREIPLYPERQRS